MMKKEREVEEKAQSEKDLWNSRKEALNIAWPSQPRQEIPNLGKKVKGRRVLLTAKYSVS